MRSREVHEEVEVRQKPEACRRNPELLRIVGAHEEVATSERGVDQ